MGLLLNFDLYHYNMKASPEPPNRLDLYYPSLMPNLEPVSGLSSGGEMVEDVQDADRDGTSSPSRDGDSYAVHGTFGTVTSAKRKLPASTGGV